MLGNRYIGVVALLLSIWNSEAYAALNLRVPDSPEYQGYVDVFKQTILEAPTSTRSLVITLGENELGNQLSSQDQTPIVALLVNSTRFVKVIEEYKGKSRPQVTAIFSDPNPRLQVELARKLAPGKSILIAGTSGNPIYPPAWAKIKKEGADQIYYPVGDIKPLIADMDRYDVLVAIPDNNIYNVSTIQSITSSLYRREKFIVGYSAGMVKAGALATITSDKEQISQQLLALVNQYILTGTLKGPSYPSEFSVIINKSLARSLGITATDEIELQKIITEATQAGGAE